MFNEVEKKIYDKQINLILNREEDGLLSPWQISDLFSKLSSTYYKTELLNTISIAINEGIKPENIFIMDDSFQINNNYYYVGLLNLNKIKDARDFYHLGIPTPMFPNYFIFKLSIVFEYYSETFTYLNSKDLDVLDKGKIKDIVEKTYNNEGIKPAMLQVLNMAKDIIKTRTTVLENEAEIISDVSEIYEKYKTKFERIEKDTLQIRELDTMIKSNTYLNTLKTGNNNKFDLIEKRYFKNFFERFRDLKRPIVGIYDFESNNVQILCSNFINKGKADSKVFDIKQFSHNSPYFLSVILGLGIGAPILKFYSLLRDERTIEKESAAIEKEEEISKTNLESALSLIADINSSPENMAKFQIENDYLKNKVLELQEHNDIKFNEPIVQYGFNTPKTKLEMLNAHE